MDIKIQPCSVAEKENWISFLDENFGYKQEAKNQSYGTDFSPWFEKENFPFSRLIYKDGKIISSGSLYPTRVMVDHAEVAKVGIIGAVATSESLRGQGFSKQVLQELEMMARACKLDALVLWSDQFDFYHNLGFELFGSQLIHELDAFVNTRQIPAGKVVDGWDLSQIPTLYNEHRSRCQRTGQYWKSLEKITSVTRKQWVDPNGKVLAYLAYDRGKDLQNIIHEWGGSADALCALLQNILAGEQRKLFWMTAAFLKDPVVQCLHAEAAASPLIDQPLALVKILKPELKVIAFEKSWFWGLDSL